SVAAILTAVGSPSATSSAKLGPEITPTGDGQRDATTMCGRATPDAVVGSSTKPLPSQTSGASVSPRSAATNSSSAAMGVATGTSDAPAIVDFNSALMEMP